MERAVYQIFECLFVHIKCKNGKLARMFCPEGTLFIAINAESLKRDVNQLQCFATIAGAGELGSSINEKLHEAIKAMLPNVSIRTLATQEEIVCLHENLGVAPFQLTFELLQNAKDLMLDCIGTKQLIHRISVVHPKVKIHYCIKVNNAVSAETYRLHSYGVDMCCTQIHPVQGETINLLIPNKAAEMGLTGELQLELVTAICPCSKMHPNRLPQITSVYIFFYSSLGLPICFQSRGKSLSFFEDIFHVKDWEMIRQDIALVLDKMLEEDVVTPDIKYISGPVTGQHDDLDVVQQTILLFLFVDYSDRFQSEILDSIEAYSMIVNQMDHIFLCNQYVLKEAMQLILKMTLEKQYKTERNQVKLQLSHGVVSDSMCSIVTNSTNSSFRRKCLSNFQVSDAREFRVAVEQSLQRISINRVLQGQTCDIKNANKQTRPSECLLPTTNHTLSQRHSKSYMCQTDSSNREININKNSKMSKGIDECMTNLQDGPGNHFESDVFLRYCDLRSDECKENPFRVDTERHQHGINNQVQQEDDAWFQEVSNLSEWAW
ncbi:type 2 DNA topoisomerase 6 subunit B-like isoform X3 [Lissotriton helveticus]